jgi:hypothetical protein
MANHRDIAGSQQTLRPEFAGGLAPEAVDLRRFMSPGLADLLREGAATVRYGLRTARHRVLPDKPTGDTLQCPWTPHQMP